MKQYILLTLLLVLSGSLYSVTVKNMSSESVTIHDLDRADNREIYMMPSVLQPNKIWEQSGIKGLHITLRNKQTDQPCTTEFTHLTDRSMIFITQDQQIYINK